MPVTFNSMTREGLVGEDAGDLLLEEGRGDGVCWQHDEYEDPICKEIRKFRSIMTQNLSFFPYINARTNTKRSTIIIK
jgi:hypothetical protein